MPNLNSATSGATISCPAMLVAVVVFLFFVAPAAGVVGLMVGCLFGGTLLCVWAHHRAANHRDP